MSLRARNIAYQPHTGITARSCPSLNSIPKQHTPQRFPRRAVNVIRHRAHSSVSGQSPRASTIKQQSPLKKAMSAALCSYNHRKRAAQKWRGIKGALAHALQSHLSVGELSVPDPGRRPAQRKEPKRLEHDNATTRPRILGSTARPTDTRRALAQALRPFDNDPLASSPYTS